MKTGGRSWDAGSNLQKILDTTHFYLLYHPETGTYLHTYLWGFWEPILTENRISGMLLIRKLGRRRSR